MNFFSYIRVLTNESRITLHLPERSSVRDLLGLLAERYDGVFGDLLIGEESRIRQQVAILINGKGVGILNGLDTPLRDGDSVSILPAVGGG